MTAQYNRRIKRARRLAKHRRTKEKIREAILKAAAKKG